MQKAIKSLLKILIALLLILLIIASSLAIIYRLFPVKYASAVARYSSLYNVDENLVFALIKAESNFNKNAVSRAGAKGLMQLTEDTFNHIRGLLEEKNSDDDILSPSSNIEAGVRYLSYLLDKYNQNETNAVAAYNAGPSNVDKWLCDPTLSANGKELLSIPFGETKRHCEKIERYRKIYSILYCRR